MIKAQGVFEGVVGGSSGGVHSLGYQAKDGDRAHEEDGVVELGGSMFSNVDSKIYFQVPTATHCFAGDIALLVVCPGLDEEPSQVGEAGLLRH